MVQPSTLFMSSLDTMDPLQVSYNLLTKIVQSRGTFKKEGFRHRELARLIRLFILTRGPAKKMSDLTPVLFKTLGIEHTFNFTFL